MVQANHGFTTQCDPQNNTYTINVNPDTGSYQFNVDNTNQQLLMFSPISGMSVSIINCLYKIDTFVVVMLYTPILMLYV